MSNNMRFKAILPLLLILFMVGIVNASWTPVNYYSNTIVAWTNITVNNYQTVSSNAGLAIKLDVNTLNYSAYTNGNFNNWAVFNGFTQNILYSWAEGNVYNETRYTGLNTITDFVIWVSLPQSLGSTTNSINSITLGFYQPTVNTMNGNDIGESGLLSLKQAGSCSEYDNGAKLFTYYQSFCGVTSLANIGWTNTIGATVGGLSATSSNVFIGSSVTTAGNQIFDKTFPMSANAPGNTFDSLINLTVYAASRGGVGSFTGNSVTTQLGQGQCEFCIKVSNSGTVGVTAQGTAVSTIYNIATQPAITQVYSFVITNTVAANGLVNYKNDGQASAGTGSLSSNTVAVISSNSVPTSVYWIRTRQTPPSNTLPTLAYSDVYPYSISLVKVSNTVILANQYQTVTGTWSGGVSPYTTNWYVTNTATGAVVANQLLSGQSLTTNSFTFQQPSSSSGLGGQTVKLTITDSAHTSISATNTFTGNPAFSVGTISPAAPNIIIGQSVNFTSSASGGLPPYSYKWYQSSANPGTASCNPANQIAGITGSYYVKTPPGVGTGRWFTYQVTDSESPTNTLCSSVVQLITSPTETLTLTATNTYLDLGQYTTLTASAPVAIGRFTTGVYNYTNGYNQSQLSITSGGSNTFTFQFANAPLQVQIPAGSGITEYIPIVITNLQNITSSQYYQFPLNINLTPVSPYLSNNLKNLEFFYANGTLIPSWLEGNSSNPLNTGGAGATENLGNSTFFLNLSRTLYNSNFTAANMTYLANKNHPSCSGTDPEVADPTGLHGLGLGTTPGGTGYKKNATQPWVLPYLLAFNGICYVQETFTWSQIEPQQGVYNFTPIVNGCAVWVNNGIKCSPAYFIVGYSNASPPPWVTNTVPYITPCGDTKAAAGGGDNIPLYGNVLEQILWGQFISNTSIWEATNSFMASNTYYTKYGIGIGEEDFPYEQGNATCVSRWAAQGYSPAQFVAYTENIIKYESNASKFTHEPTQIELNDITGQENATMLISTFATNRSLLVGSETLESIHYNQPYFSGKRTDVNTSIWAGLYQGKTPFQFQYTTGTYPAPGQNGYCQCYTANNLQWAIIYGHAQLFEVPIQEYLLAFNSMAPNAMATCPNPSGIGSETCQAAYSQALFAAANVLGYRNVSGSTNNLNKPNLPLPTQTVIYMGLAPKGTRLMTGVVSGEAGYLNSGSGCLYDNGANVFAVYNSFCGLSGQLASWSSTGGLTIGFTTSGETIKAQVSGTTGTIYTPTGASASAGNVIYALMSMVPAGLKTNSFGSTFGAFNSNSGLQGNCVAGIASNSLGDNYKTCVQQNANVLKTAISTKNILYGINLDNLSTTKPDKVTYTLNITSFLISNTANFNHHPSDLVIATTNAVTSTNLYTVFISKSSPNDVSPIARLGYPVSTTSSQGLLTQTQGLPYHVAYGLIGTDTGSSGTTPYQINSSLVNIEYSPDLVSTGFSATNVPILENTYETLIANVSGGTSPYTYNFLVYNSLGTLVYNALYIGVPLPTNSTTFQINEVWGFGLFTWNVIITDNATTSMSVTNTLSFHVDPSPPVATISAPSNAIVDVGQYESFTGNVAGGENPYTFNFLVVNSNNLGKIIYNGLFSSSSHGYLYTYQTGTTDTSNSPLKANVIITDSNAFPDVVNSLYSATYTENPTLIAGIPTASNTVLDSGQETLLTANPSGGTTSYTYKWYNNNNAAPTCDPANILGGATSQTTLRTPPNTKYYAYNVTDSASSQASACSPSVFITVNPAQSTPTISASSTPNVQGGATETFTAIGSGGTSPYTYNFIVVNTITNHQLANMLTTSTSFAWVVPVADVGNTISANVFITDSPTTPTVVNSIKLSTVTITSGYTSPTITISAPSNALASVGQYECFTGTVSSGTSPFTYIFNAYSGSTSTNTATFTGVASNTKTWCYYLTAIDQTNSPLKANVLLTDSSPTTVNSILSSAYTINAMLTAGLITETNTIITSGQYSRLTATSNGGTLPITYNWFASNSCGGVSVGTGSSILVNPTSTTTYTFNVVDSGTTNAIVCSTSNTVSVNGGLSAGAITATNSVLDNGQYTTLTANPSGGTLPYTAYQWYTGAACTSAIGGATSSTYTSNPSSTTTYYYKVTDSASATACSSGFTITVNTALTIPTLVASNTPNVNTNGYELFSAYESGGTTSYTYDFKVYNSVTKILVQTISQSSNTFLWQVTNNQGNTIYANVFVTDSATSPITVNSILTPAISVQSGLTINISAAKGVEQGKSIFVTSTPSGGVSPYTYNWFVNDPGAGGYYKIVGATTNIYTFSNTVELGVWDFISQVRDHTGLIVNSSPLQVVVSGTPVLFNTNLSMSYGQQYTIIAQANPSSDQANLYLTPVGQQQGNPIATTLPAPTGGVITYTLCAQGNFCPTIGYWTINVIDNTSGADPASNFVVEAPIFLKNTTTTLNITRYTPQACSTNLAGGSCTGNEVYTGNIVLTKNLFVYGNITVNSGQTLWTNGYSVVTNGNLVINGYISANTLGNGFSVSCAVLTCASLPNSYGGSGGGTGQNNGGNTLVNGGYGNVAGGHANGATPSAPTMSNANVILFYNQTTKYLGGAGGGAGYQSGNGAYGMILEANVISGTGTVNAIGLSGATDGTNGGAGGGGGVILEVTKNGVQGISTTVTGGAGSGGSGTTGGVGGAGQVVQYQYTNPPIPSATYTTYFPISLNASITNPTTFYTVNQVLNSVSSTDITNANGFVFQPNAVQPSGLYEYNISETQYSNTINLYVNVSVNMTSVTSALTCNTLIEYNPNFCFTPTFTQSPQSWYIQGDNPQNEPHNTVVGDQWSNANQTVATAMILAFTGFSPYPATAQNNPALQSSLSLTPYLLIPTNSAPPGTYTRLLANILTYDEQFKTSLLANTTYDVFLRLNNYSLPVAVNAYVSNSFSIYVPQSNYQNPTITVYNVSTFSTAPSHFSTINNYFNTNIGSSTPVTYSIYLPNLANASLYSFQISSCASTSLPNEYMIVQGGSSSSTAQQLQSFKVTQTPFALSLQNGLEYRFVFYNTAGTQQIFSSAFSVWTNPIQMSIPCNITSTPLTFPQINATCINTHNSTTNLNFTVCQGTDTRDFVTSWTVQAEQRTNILQSQIVNTTTLNGASFYWKWQIPNASSQYTIYVRANVNDPQPVSVLTWLVNLITPKSPISNNAWYGIMLFLAVLAVAYYHDGMSLIAGIAIVFFGQIIGIYTLTVSAFGSLVLVIITIVMLLWDKK